MVVHFLDDGSAEKLSNLPAYPISPGVGILPAEVHALDVLIAEIAIGVDYARINVHAVFGPGLFQEPRRNLVSQAARTKMHADPHAV